MTKYTWVKEVDTGALETQRTQREATREAARAAAILHDRGRYERELQQREEELAKDAIQAEIDRAQRKSDAKWIAETRQKSASDNFLWLGCTTLLSLDQSTELFELLQATRDQYLLMQD